MNNHLVSIYLRAGAIAHVQATNGDVWPDDVIEKDKNGIVVPLIRRDVTIEPTPQEIADGRGDRPAPRSASDLFRTQLEFKAGRVSYRVGVNLPGAITDRIPGPP